MSLRRFPLCVALQAGTGEFEPVSLAATIYAPPSILENPVVMVCFPGGGMTQRYFDLDGASFAEAMAKHGIITIAFDHPCIGGSTCPADPTHLTARHLANMEAHAVHDTVRKLHDGSAHTELQPIAHFTLIGVGHSMGAMLVALQQAAFRPYAALALLGFSTRGLPEVLTPEEQAQAKQTARDDASYIALAEQRFGGQALAELPSRADGQASLRSAAAPLLTAAAMQSMLPGNIAVEAATIVVPLMLAVGDRDIAGRPEAIAPRFSAARDIRLLVLENTGHHPFVSPAAPRLYAELSAWAGTIGART